MLKGGVIRTKIGVAHARRRAQLDQASRYVQVQFQITPESQHAGTHLEVGIVLRQLEQLRAWLGLRQPHKAFEFALRIPVDRQRVRLVSSVPADT